MLYLYLFGKRFMISVQYLKRLISKFLAWLFKSSLSRSSKFRLLNLNSHIELPHPEFAQSKLRVAIQRFRKVFCFFYNLFISIQLCYLGYAESIRLKNMFKFLAKNSRKIRIKNANHGNQEDN